MELDKPSEDGDTVIHLVSDVPSNGVPPESLMKGTLPGSFPWIT